MRSRLRQVKQFIMSVKTPVIIGGTVALDNVKTPTASVENVLGGSAAYAAVSCSYFTDQTRLLGVVGRDFPQEYLEMLSSKGVNLEGIEQSEKESFLWTGEYLEGMAERETLAVAVNVLEDWKVTVPEAVADSPIVVLANMSPENQLQMLSQITAEPKFILADTMDIWMNIARKQLDEVLKQVDCLVVNEGEAKLLTGETNLILAGEKMRAQGLKHVIIKVGEFGSYLFGPDDAFYRVPAFPLKNFVDPTGAGDSFLGAMAGYLSGLNTLDFTTLQLRDAMVRGSVASSFTCEDFSTHKLQEVDAGKISARMDALKEMSCW